MGVLCENGVPIRHRNPSVCPDSGNGQEALVLCPLRARACLLLRAKELTVGDHVRLKMEAVAMAGD